jgi:hypothetical protein
MGRIEVVDGVVKSVGGLRRRKARTSDVLNVRK